LAPAFGARASEFGLRQGRLALKHIAFFGGQMELDHFGNLFSCGYQLSIDERASLETQMVKKQQEEKLAGCVRAPVTSKASLSRNPHSTPLPSPPTTPLPSPPSSVRFWGRVLGTTCDYLVVCGVLTSSEFPERKWFYATSKDLVLVQMPLATPEVAAQAEALASTRFVGSPGQVLGADADAAEEEEELDEEGNPKPKKARFSEAHRLAATVALLERDCGVVPKGAYAVTATRHVIPNAAFAGVPASMATSLAPWAHFRKPLNPVRAATLAKAAAVPGTDDFLDGLSEDVAPNLWATQLDAGKGVARVASLRYPGYFAFATVDGSGKWGSVYVGDGRAEQVQWMV